MRGVENSQTKTRMGGRDFKLLQGHCVSNLRGKGEDESVAQLGKTIEGTRLGGGGGGGGGVGGGGGGKRPSGERHGSFSILNAHS